MLETSEQKIPAEAAGHIYDTLIELEKQAEQYQEIALSHLLRLAAEEARTMNPGYARDTMPPG